MRSLPAALLVFFLAPAAQAAVLISSLGQAHSSNLGMTNTSTRHAVDFITDVDTALLTTLSFDVRNADNIAHNFTGEIWTDASGNPGAMVESFDTVATAPAGMASFATFSLSDAGIVLSAATKYWVVVRMNENRNSASAVNLSAAANQTMDGGGVFTADATTQGKSSTNGGSSWVNIGTPSLRYSLEGASPVPEPGRSVLALLGIAAISLRRRRS